MKTLLQQVKDNGVQYLNSTDEKTLINLAIECLEKNFKNNPTTILNNKDAENYLKLQLADEEREVFGALFLNTKHHIISFEKLFFGSLATATVHARIIVKRALELNCAAVIFTHNHPSNDPTPSPQDIKLTKELKEILKVVDIDVLDHIIVTKKDCTALMAENLL
jgi:DNA repair protein RadC